MQNRTLIGSVDPGLSGGYCLLDPINHTIKLMKTPTADIINTTGRRKIHIDCAATASFFDQNEVVRLYLEDVYSMPGEAHDGAFTFGETKGIIRGIAGALKIPLTTISPAKWKKMMNCPKNKDAARALASRLLPGFEHNWKLKNQDGVAEAALMGLYGMADIGFQIKKKFSPMEE